MPRAVTMIPATKNLFTALPRVGVFQRTSHGVRENASLMARSVCHTSNSSATKKESTVRL